MNRFNKLRTFPTIGSKVKIISSDRKLGEIYINNIYVTGKLGKIVQIDNLMKNGDYYTPYRIETNINGFWDTYWYRKEDFKVE